MTTLVTLLHIYVFVRLDALPLRRNLLSRKALIAAAVALWLLFLLGRLYGGNEFGFLTITLEVAGMHWMASVFILAVALFASDLVCWIGVLFGRRLARIRTLGAVLGLGLILFAHAQGLLPPGIERYEVTIDRLPASLDGTTIAVMTDLHVGEMMVGSEWLAARVDQVLALEPDLIVLVGDLFERGSDPDQMVPIMQRLSAPLGVWAVRGNHDSLRAGRRNVAGEILAGAKIRLLENEWVNLAEGLLLAGIDDLTSSRRRPGEGEASLKRTLADRPDAATLFLSHTPWLTEGAAAAGVDIMFSGHTHNGQIWPFNYLVRTRYPLSQGRYEVDGMTLLVSRGTGTWGPRMRLWAGNEISHVTLRAR